MGTCTSTKRHRYKDQQQLHKRITQKNSIAIDNQHILPLSLNLFANQRLQLSQTSSSNINVQSSCLKDPNFHPINSNSLIHLYLPNTNNCDRNSWMSSSYCASNVSTRIPIAKARLSTYQNQSISPPIGPLPSNNDTTRVGITNQLELTRPMSTPIRSSLTSTLVTTTQPRFGYIPRPVAPSLQQAQISSLITRSRSISPSSTKSAASSTTNTSQRLAKAQTATKSTSNRLTPSTTNPTYLSKSKTISSSHANHITTTTNNNNITNTNNNNKDYIPSKVTTNRLRSLAISQNSPTPPSISVPTSSLAKTTNVNVIRDRYKTQKRMTFYERRATIPNSRKSSLMVKEQKSERSSANELVAKASMDHLTDDLKTESSQQVSSSRGDSAYASVTLPLNPVSSVKYSQPRCTSSTLSSSSHLSDVLNNDAFLDDENCSLKSDDLLCDYDDTLTLESISKNERADSFSSTSLSIETNKKSNIPKSATATKPNVPLLQSISKENQPTITSRGPRIDKINASLRESLDELTQLSNRMENIIDGEHNRRLLTRSVSLKPPPASLPPREDGEQIIMDIESYRQIMKDIMVVKTIFHQLDRLLKHSDGNNMTDSMIGSFHESTLGLRHYSSSSGDGNLRNTIDENSSYDDLLKEIIILRKEREQDKQTIKLLQEQMYKYSSQTNV